MIPEQAILYRVTAILDRLAVPYVVTGSLASSLHGTGDSST